MKLRKKLFMMLVFIMVLGLVLAGCGGNSETTGENNETDETNEPTEPTEVSEPKNESVELRIVTMFGGTDPATEVLNEALKQFEAEHPGVKVVNDSMTAGDAFNTKVSTDFTSGNEPDVLFYFTGANAKSFLDAGKVVPLDEVIAGDETWNSGFSQAALDQMKEKDGNLYAIPVTGYYEGLIVNKAMFEEHGVDLPTDWAKYEAAIEAFAEKGITPISQSLPESWYLIEHYLLAAGGPDGHNTPYHDSWAKGLKVIKKHADMGAFPRDANTIDDAMSQNIFDTEQAAMMINGSWAIGGLSPEMQEKSIVLPIPMMPGSPGTDGDIIAGFSAGFYLTKKAHDDVDKKDISIELIKFLTSLEKIEEIATANGGVPAAKVTVPGLTPAAASGHAFVANANSNSFPADSMISKDAFTHIRTNVPQIAAGEKTAEEVVEEAKELE